MVVVERGITQAGGGRLSGTPPALYERHLPELGAGRGGKGGLLVGELEQGSCRRPQVDATPGAEIYNKVEILAHEKTTARPAVFKVKVAAGAFLTPLEFY
jgi:hypothetical protein